MNHLVRIKPNLLFDTNKNIGRMLQKTRDLFYPGMDDQFGEIS